jgi:S1-C subfamily serine protease
MMDNNDVRFSPNDSVVKVYVTSNSYNYKIPWAAPTQQQSYGSGFIIEGKRIVTNAHVVSEGNFVQVRKAGSSTKYEAKIKRILHDVDLAILEISDVKNVDSKTEEFFENTKPLILGPTPHVGDTVRAYGFPWGGNEMSLTKGVVSRVEMGNVAHTRGYVNNVSISSNVLSCDMDTAITNGNSGGPVMAIPGDNFAGLNVAYKEAVVVGVVFQGYSGKEGGYMIASEVLKRAIALDDIGETLRIPCLGIVTQILENPSLRKSLGLMGSMQKNTGMVKMADPSNVTILGCVENNNDSINCKVFIQPDKVEIVDGSKKIEGGIMVTRVGDLSTVKDVLKKRDVLLEIDDFKIGANGTIEFRKGERTSWTYCIGRKCLGESVTLKFFRNGCIYTYTLPLDKTKGDICHFGQKEHEVKPEFLLKSGFVFQPLTLNLCTDLRFGSDVEASLLDYKSNTNPGYVLMTKVLQNESTTGYDMNNQIVKMVNGKNIHTMMDLIDAFKEKSVDDDQSVKEEKEHCIELYSDDVIIIISNNLEEDTKNIANRYDIPNTEYLRNDHILL